MVCGGLRWFVVVCGGLWWFVVDCGGLSFSHTLIVIYSQLYHFKLHAVVRYSLFDCRE